MLVDLFSRIETFIKRLGAYTDVQSTSAMTGIIIKITVEVLTILGIATGGTERRRLSEPINIY